MEVGSQLSAQQKKLKVLINQEFSFADKWFIDNRDSLQFIVDLCDNGALSTADINSIFSQLEKAVLFQHKKKYSEISRHLHFFVGHLYLLHYIFNNQEDSLASDVDDGLGAIKAGSSLSGNLPNFLGAVKALISHKTFTEKSTLELLRDVQCVAFNPSYAESSKLLVYVEKSFSADVENLQAKIAALLELASDTKLEEHQLAFINCMADNFIATLCSMVQTNYERSRKEISDIDVAELISAEYASADLARSSLMEVIRPVFAKLNSISITSAISRLPALADAPELKNLIVFMRASQQADKLSDWLLAIFEKLKSFDSLAGTNEKLNIDLAYILDRLAESAPALTTQPAVVDAAAELAAIDAALRVVLTSLETIDKQSRDPLDSKFDDGEFAAEKQRLSAVVVALATRYELIKHQVDREANSRVQGLFARFRKAEAGTVNYSPTSETDTTTPAAVRDGYSDSAEACSDDDFDCDGSSSSRATSSSVDSTSDNGRGRGGSEYYAGLTDGSRSRDGSEDDGYRVFYTAVGARADCFEYYVSSFLSSFKKCFGCAEASGHELQRKLFEAGSGYGDSSVDGDAVAGEVRQIRRAKIVKCSIVLALVVLLVALIIAMLAATASAGQCVVAVDLDNDNDNDNDEDANANANANAKKVYQDPLSIIMTAQAGSQAAMAVWSSAVVVGSDNGCAGAVCYNSTGIGSACVSPAAPVNIYFPALDGVWFNISADEPFCDFNYTFDNTKHTQTAYLSAPANDISVDPASEVFFGCNYPVSITNTSRRQLLLGLVDDSSFAAANVTVSVDGFDAGFLANFVVFQHYPAPSPSKKPAPAHYPAPSPSKKPAPAPAHHPAPSKPAPAHHPAPSPSKKPAPAPSKKPAPAPSKKPAPAPTEKTCAWTIDIPPQGDPETINLGVTETTTKSVVAATRYSYVCPSGITYTCLPDLGGYFPNHGNTVCTGSVGGVITYVTTTGASAAEARSLRLASDTLLGNSASSVVDNGASRLAPSCMAVAAASLFGAPAALLRSNHALRCAR
jgi:hypothetical protein